MGSIKNAAPFLEFSIEDPDWAKNLYEPKLKIVDGKVVFPEGPGWGVTINRDWLSKADYKKSE
jgi:L-alanine-DL-glutamate epimerase-like enolase superfamily enzyme